MAAPECDPSGFVQSGHRDPDFVVGRRPVPTGGGDMDETTLVEICEEPGVAVPILALGERSAVRIPRRHDDDRRVESGRPCPGGADLIGD